MASNSFNWIMMQRRSTLFASRGERPRLAPPWAIALIALLVVGLMVLIFPRQALIQRMVTATEQSELGAAYLDNLLRTDPDNPELRLVLARQQYRSGKLDSAEATLRVAFSSPQASVREDAAWLLWSIRVHEFERLEADSPQRSEALAALRRQLAELASRPWSETMTLELARYALGIGDDETGLRLLEELAQRRSDAGPELFERAAGEALGRGQYRAASALYFAARGRAATLAERRRTYIAGLHALQQGNLMNEAVAAGERELKDLGDDRDALYALIELARAANRIDIADKYARRMLRISLLDEPSQAVASAAMGAWRLRLVAADAADIARLPFDDKSYRLGYDVFLNAGKPADAYRVAAAAVRAVPQDLAWRERLARAAEWSNQPRVALDNWLFLARHSGRDEYWQNVLRLAPGLFDDQALLAALRYQLARTPGEAQLQRALVDVYERLGQPQEALQYLRSLRRRSADSQLLEAIAVLAERSGDFDGALAAWRQRFKDAPPTPALAMQAATLMLQMNHIDEAQALLSRVEAQANDSDADYWRLSGELAQQKQQDARALAAYRHLLAGGMAQANDYAAAVAMLRDSEPAAATAVAIAGWRKFHRLDLFRTALSLLAAQDRWDEAGRLLSEPDAAQRRELARLPDFLQLRSRCEQHRGARTAARRDLEAALALDPGDASTRQALLWLAIDGNDAGAVRRLLARHEREWAADPAMHDALGAAWQSLSLPQYALERYLTPHLREHRGDFLWLMNYADALEQNRQSEQAWSLRRALLRRSQANRRVAAAVGGELPPGVRRLAEERLRMNLTGGDERLGALREMLRLDRDSQGRLSPAAREAVLSWYQDGGEYSAERAYLWQHYGQTLSRPLWADLASALAADDGEGVDRVLARGGERLSRYDRVRAEERVGDIGRAQSDAFDAAGVQRNDDELHAALNDVLNRYADNWSIGATVRDLGMLAEYGSSAGVQHVVSARLRLSAAAEHIRRSDRDSAAIAQVPAAESGGSIGMRWLGDDGESRLTIGARHSLRDYDPLQLEHDHKLGDGWSIYGGLGLHLPAAESEALRVAGMKDEMQLGLSHSGNTGRVSMRWSDARYAGQTGTGLGKGSAWQAEAALPLLRGTPDLECSGFASRFSFAPGAAVSDRALQDMVPAGSGLSVTNLFMPTAFRFYGLRLSSNMRYQGADGESTRRLQPYGALAWTHHSELGPGYEAMIGVSGGVIGSDRLSLAYTLAKGGSAIYDHVREAGLYYRQQF
jgi:predicted Zn-dependent protease